MLRQKASLSLLAMFMVVIPIFSKPNGISKASPDFSVPHFGSGIILYRSENEFLEARLSANSNYVFGYGVPFKNGDFMNGHEDWANLHLWDVQEFEGNAIVIEPEAISTATREATNDYYRKALFSPDGNQVIFRTGDELQLLDLPSLQIATSIPFSGNFLSWAWTGDGKVIATLTSTEAIVWEINANRVEKKPRDNIGQYVILENLDMDWLFFWENGDQRSIFGVCTPFLETCTSYENTEYKGDVIISPDAEIILGELNYRVDDATTEIGIWHRQADNQYILDETFPRDVCEPSNFSPDSHYLVVYCDDSRAWQIWDFETLEVMSSIAAASTEPFWLPDSQYLVALERGAWNLILYEVGNSEPLEVLHLPSIAGFENLQDWVDGEQFSIESISADGKLVLINLGWASILVPIVYE